MPDQVFSLIGGFQAKGGVPPRKPPEGRFGWASFAARKIENGTLRGGGGERRNRFVRNVWLLMGIVKTHFFFPIDLLQPGKPSAATRISQDLGFEMVHDLSDFALVAISTNR